MKWGGSAVGVAPATPNIADSRRRVAAVGLTRSAKKFIENVLSIHSKMVQAVVRALNAKEQDSLSASAASRAKAMCRGSSPSSHARRLNELRRWKAIRPTGDYSWSHYGWRGDFFFAIWIDFHDPFSKTLT